MKPHHEDFDVLLDQALISYTSQEPRNGLELRILNRIAASRNLEAPRLNPTTIGTWTVAGVLAVVALVLAIGIWTHVAPPASSAQLDNNAPQADAIRAQISPSRPQAKVKSAPSRVSLREVRKPDSNTPAKVHEAKALNPTKQELLLQQLVAKGTSKALAFSSWQQNSLAASIVAPIEDKPIQIRPLSTEPISIAPIRIAALQPLSNPTE